MQRQQIKIVVSVTSRNAAESEFHAHGSATDKDLFQKVPDIVDRCVRQVNIFLAWNRSFGRYDVNDVVLTFTTDGCVQQDAQFVSNTIENRQPVKFA